MIATRVGGWWSEQMGGCGARAITIMWRQKFPLPRAVGRGSWQWLMAVCT